MKLNRPAFPAGRGFPPARSAFTANVPSTTYQGGRGYTYSPKSELFLRGATSLFGESTFYETAATRDARYAELIHDLATTDPAWVAEFLAWLRGPGGIRTAAVAGAAEFAAARRGAGGDGLTRRAVAAACGRPDEPGELLAYWTGRYGPAVPQPVKRGLADAVTRLYRERTVLKYDTPTRPWRFGRVIDVVHPRPSGPWQSDLFRHCGDRMRRRNPLIPARLAVLTEHAELTALPVAARRAFLLANPDRVAQAGFTWEAVGGWLQGPMDGPAWEAVLPQLGVHALLKNLRNLDEAGVSDAAAGEAARRLADRDRLGRERLLPLAVLAAARAAPSARWAWPLEQCLQATLAAVPALPGSTLILIDTSSSMDHPLSERSSLRRWDAAVVFGLALASRAAAADVVSFSSSARYWGEPDNPRTLAFPRRAGESLLRSVERWSREGYFLGGGTNTAGALLRHYNSGHSRVIILTDEQAEANAFEVGAQVPPGVPLYTFNVAGYRAGHAPAGTPWRHTFGGLTDAHFAVIPHLEAGRTGRWPWEQSGAAA